MRDVKKRTRSFWKRLRNRLLVWIPWAYSTRDSNIRKTNCVIRRMKMRSEVTKLQDVVGGAHDAKDVMRSIQYCPVMLTMSSRQRRIIRKGHLKKLGKLAVELF